MRRAATRGIAATRSAFQPRLFATSQRTIASLSVDSRSFEAKLATTPSLTLSTGDKLYGPFIKIVHSHEDASYTPSDFMMAFCPNTHSDGLWEILYCLEGVKDPTIVFYTDQMPIVDDPYELKGATVCWENPSSLKIFPALVCKGDYVSPGENPEVNSGFKSTMLTQVKSVATQEKAATLAYYAGLLGDLISKSADDHSTAEFTTTRLTA